MTTSDPSRPEMRVDLGQGLRTSGEVVRWCASLLTTAAAAIHFAVTPEHFDEDWALGIFFAAAARSQLAWALLVARSGERRLLFAGITGNLAIALVWVASRTIGVPMGPDPRVREAVGLLDVLATAFEVLAAVSIVLAGRLEKPRMPARRAIAIIAALALVVIPLTTTAIAIGPDHAQTRRDTGRTHEQPQG